MAFDKMNALTRAVAVVISVVSIIGVFVLVLTALPEEEPAAGEKRDAEYESLWGLAQSSKGAEDIRTVQDASLWSRTARNGVEWMVTSTHEGSTEKGEQPNLEYTVVLPSSPVSRDCLERYPFLASLSSAIPLFQASLSTASTNNCQEHVIQLQEDLFDGQGAETLNLDLKMATAQGVSKFITAQFLSWDSAEPSLNMSFTATNRSTSEEERTMHGRRAAVSAIRYASFLPVLRASPGSLRVVLSRGMLKGGGMVLFRGETTSTGETDATACYVKGRFFGQREPFPVNRKWFPLLIVHVPRYVDARPAAEATVRSGHRQKVYLHSSTGVLWDNKEKRFLTDWRTLVVRGSSEADNLTSFLHVKEAQWATTVVTNAMGQRNSQTGEKASLKSARKGWTPLLSTEVDQLVAPSMRESAHSAKRAALPKRVIVLVGDSTIREIFHVLSRVLCLRYVRESVQSDGVSTEGKETTCDNSDQHVLHFVWAGNWAEVIDAFNRDTLRSELAQATLVLTGVGLHSLCNEHTSIAYESVKASIASIARAMAAKSIPLPRRHSSGAPPLRRVFAFRMPPPPADSQPGRGVSAPASCSISVQDAAFLRHAVDRAMTAVFGGDCLKQDESSCCESSTVAALRLPSIELTEAYPSTVLDTVHVCKAKGEGTIHHEEAETYVGCITTLRYVLALLQWIQAM